MTESEKKAAKEARNAYAREWRKKNPDRVRANNQAYWARKAKRKELSQEEKGESLSIIDNLAKGAS